MNKFVILKKYSVHATWVAHPYLYETEEEAVTCAANFKTYQGVYDCRVHELMQLGAPIFID
jgi:hypothetical protein